MEIRTLPYASVPQLAAKDTAYATAHPALRPFYQYDVTLESFRQVIADKRKDPIDRELLVQVLEKQYAGLSLALEVKKQVQALLNPNTFTVATAHQPALFTGPLYYVYKIFSTINLAEQLQQHFPDCHFVPVFVNGAEDHDFEEVNHANVFGKRIVWENQEKGSVGMMNAATLQPALEQLQEVLGESEHARHIFAEIKAAYTSHNLYGRAALDLVNRLFGKYGLVVIDMNNPQLKRRFLPIMREEMFQQPSQKLIEKTQAELTAAGFSGQAHAREINLFYLREQVRARIVREGDLFQVLDTNIQFTAAEMEQEMENHPECFSPNVVLRPLFQESILPNLAYVGGGGEIAYWLERKSQFAHFKVNFPVLVRRNSVLWIDRGLVSKMEKLGLQPEEFFQDTDALIRYYIEKQATSELNLASEIAQLNALFESVREKAIQVDPTLDKAVQAEAVKQVKILEQLEGRLVRAEKQKHDTALNQIRAIREKLFPGNGLQERHDNFLNFYLKYGENFFQVLKDNLDPFAKGFMMVVDKN